MKYNILTTSDSIYFPFLKILINSILDTCNLSKINSIYVIDNGLNDDQLNYLDSVSHLIKFIETGHRTNFKGGIWGEDWQINVKSKTDKLYSLVERLREPVLLLDSDMLVLDDLYSMLSRGGDIQVCHRPNHSVEYIASYFFSINFEKSLEFIKQWKDLTFASNQLTAIESPALSKTVKLNLNNLDIVHVTQSEVNVLEPKYLTNESKIVHFKGSSLTDNIDESIRKRIYDRGWGPIVKKYQ